MLRISKALMILSMALTASAQMQNVLTNKDVVTLAKAGFNEDFIIDTIAMSRTRFDMSVNGMADLAKEGLTERLIRVMMTAGPAGAAGGPPPAAAPEISPAAAMMASPGMSDNPRVKGSRTYVVKPSATRQALSSQTPYYEWTSMFFGLWSKKVGVAGMPRNDQVVSPSVGGYYNQMRVPVTRPAPSNQQPAFPNYQGTTRYVVLQ